MCYLYKSKYGQSGGLLRNIMLTFAQFERELTSERTKDKMLQRAQKGMWNGWLWFFSAHPKKTPPIHKDKRGYQEWLPNSNSRLTVSIVLPNTIHGSRKKNL